MKKSTKITTAIVIALGIAGTSAAVAGKNYMQNHENRAEHAVSFISSKLDLDTTQEQALTALKDQVLIAKNTMSEQMQTARSDVRSLVDAESFDQGKALELVTTKTATVDAVAPELVVALGNFLDTLDASQKQEILEFMDSREGKHKRGHWRK